MDAFVRDLPVVERPTTVAFVNAHTLNLIYRDERLAGWLCNTDHLLRDGVGVAGLLRALGLPEGVNLNGTDLIPRVLAESSGRLAIFATEDPYLTMGVRRLSGELNFREKEILAVDGFRGDAEYVRLAREFRPSVIVLGMGVPKQERVANLLQAELDHACLIICGGAIVDFLGGKVRRAPRLFRAFRMEWVFRLLLEPRRLFGRYVIGNPLFVYRTLLLAASPVRPKLGVAAERTSATVGFAVPAGTDVREGRGLHTTDIRDGDQVRDLRDPNLRWYAPYVVPRDRARQ